MFIMSGSATNTITREQIRVAVLAMPPEQHYVWDGVDDDDRSLTDSELKAGLAVAVRKRGRPVGSATKEQVAIRFDREILENFRKEGPGWQTRMNDALRDWLKSHSTA
jgi:uncharacterized protein (DUF4415 family)